MGAVVLFDGVCNLCSRSVQFIIKRDPTAYFQFASLQGDYGQKQLAKHHLPKDYDSLLLVRDGVYHDQSSAVLHIAVQLGGFWKLSYLGFLIPKPVRDYMYRKVSGNRYRWFGGGKACMMPPKGWEKRFL